MATKFLQSNKVNVFPTAFRGKDANGKAIDPGAFLTNEENFVNLANKVTYLGHDYFYKDGDTIHLVLGGYYFTFSKSDVTALFDSPSTNDTISAAINVSDLSTSYANYSCKTLTPNGGSAGGILDVEESGVQRFKGLSFVSADDATTYTYKLELFVYKDSWLENAANMLNISTEQIRNGSGSTTSIDKAFTTTTLSAKNIRTNGASATIGTKTNPFSNAHITTINTSTISGIASLNLTTSAQLSALAIGGMSFVTTEGNMYFSGSTASLVTTRSMDLTAGSTITLSTSSAINLNASNINASAQTISASTQTISIATSTYSVNASSCVSIASPSCINLQAGSSTDSINVQLANASMTFNNKFCINMSTSTTVEVSATTSSFTDLQLNNFSYLVVNGHPMRPYEHRMTITLLSSGSTPVGLIFANPKLFNYNAISTKSELLAAMCEAQYFVSMHYGGETLNSPMLATGRYAYTPESAFNWPVMGLGVGGIKWQSGTYSSLCLNVCILPSSISDVMDPCRSIDEYNLAIEDVVWIYN